MGGGVGAWCCSQPSKGGTARGLARVGVSVDGARWGLLGLVHRREGLAGLKLGQEGGILRLRQWRGGGPAWRGAAW